MEHVVIWSPCWSSIDIMSCVYRFISTLSHIKPLNIICQRPWLLLLFGSFLWRCSSPHSILAKQLSPITTHTIMPSTISALSIATNIEGETGWLEPCGPILVLFPYINIEEIYDTTHIVEVCDNVIFILNRHSISILRISSQKVANRGMKNWWCLDLIA